jgi:hypothetical protein
MTVRQMPLFSLKVNEHHGQSDRDQAH